MLAILNQKALLPEWELGATTLRGVELGCSTSFGEWLCLSSVFLQVGEVSSQKSFWVILLLALYQFSFQYQILDWK
jgi:hypothetical protein